MNNGFLLTLSTQIGTTNGHEPSAQLTGLTAQLEVALPSALGVRFPPKNICVMNTYTSISYRVPITSFASFGGLHV